jgi:hypothetical protein
MYHKITFVCKTIRQNSGKQKLSKREVQTATMRYEKKRYANRYQRDIKACNSHA